MSREVIATIKLAPGRVGFYDELSRIHLTLGAPTATVLSGTNCARLRRAVRDGVVNLVDGSLGGEIPPFKIVKVGDKLKLASNIEAEIKPVFKEDVKPAAPVQEAAPEEVEEPVVEVPAEEVPAEEVVAEVPAEEEVAEETPVAEEAEEEVSEEAEEETVEEKPKKKGGRKSTKKSKE